MAAKKKTRKKTVARKPKPTEAQRMAAAVAKAATKESPGAKLSPGECDTAIPRAALEFGIPVALAFDPARFADTAADEGGDTGTAADSAKGMHRTVPFRGQVNSGGVILGHPWWGNFAIDMEGLRIPTQSQPVLANHRVDQILGRTTKISVSDAGELHAEGELFDITAIGAEVIDLAQAEFPFQMSGYFPPKQILQVEEGESVEVNGHTLNGPGHIFKVSELLEVTITPLGADANTSVALLSKGGANSEPEVEEHSITVSKLATLRGSMNDDDTTDEATVTEAEAAKMASDAAKKATEDERTRLSAIDSHASGTGIDPAKLAEMKSSGMSAGDAAVEILSMVKTSKGAALQALQNASPDSLNDDETFTEGDGKPEAPKTKAAKVASLAKMPERIDDKPNDAKFALEYELDTDGCREAMPEAEYVAFRRNTPQKGN